MMDVLLSQILSILCVNFFMYLEMALIGLWRFGEHLVPMLWITLLDLCIAMLWTVFVRWIYVKIYRPRADASDLRRI